MMRSMYTAISGLRAHQFKMDVIGNNIANVNTVGFKKSSTSFQEVFNQTTSGASAPQGGRGGTNPQQVGLGVMVGSVKVVHEQGAPQRTDDPLDFFISGNGYFVVSGDSNFNNKSYTRAGNFDLDRDGTMVTAEGLKVLGYAVDEKGNVGDTLGDIKIDKSNTIAATTTENMKLKGNLDSRLNGEDSKMTTDTIIYDSLGNPYNVKYEIQKASATTVPAATAAQSEWVATIVSMKDSEGIEKLVGTPTTTIPLGAMTFNPDGSIIRPTGTPSNGVSVGTIKDKDGNDVVGATINLNWGGNDVTTGTPGTPSGPSSFGKSGTINIDFSGLTQYGNDTTAKAYKEDGNTSGVIDSFSVSKSGEVVAVYTNGESKILAQMALAKFDNPGGLSKEGSNLFKDTRNSGEPQFGKAGGSGYGQMIGGAREMSNVDLSNEFTEMITTQRGFQANSRVITTSDEILQELVNLKR